MGKQGGNKDFNGFQLLNALWQILAADPANAAGLQSPAEGRFWYNSTLKVFRGANGTKVITFADAADVVPLSQKGAAQGVAPLGADVKIPLQYLPDTVVGGLDYQGVWNAATNTPNLAGSNPSKGDYYKVSVAGSTNLGGITDWNVGDWAVYNGAAWDKLDQTETVSSVAGRTGAIVLSAGDVAGVLAAANALSELNTPALKASARTNLALGTAAQRDAPASGDAGPAEVVLGSDSRLQAGAGGKRFSVTFGDGVASTFVITHNLNTQDVIAAVRDAAAPFAAWDVDYEATTVNTVTVRLGFVPAANALRCTVLA